MTTTDNKRVQTDRDILPRIDKQVLQLQAGVRNYCKKNVCMTNLNQPGLFDLITQVLHISLRCLFPK